MRSEYYRVDRWDKRRLTWEISGHCFDTEALARAEYGRRGTAYRWRIVRVTQEVIPPLGGEEFSFSNGDHDLRLP